MNNLESVLRPLPAITAENRSFWTGGSRSELMIAFCTDCAVAIHPPQLICPKCQSSNVEARAVSGLGKIYTFTVNHQPWLPDMEVPFAIAVVEADDAPGVRVTAQVKGSDVSEIEIGQTVRIGFQESGDVWIPHWEIFSSREAK